MTAGRRAARLPRIALVVLLSLAAGSLVLAGAGEDEARAAAQVFGSALKNADASGLRPILPAYGKVRVALVRLGPEEGLFAAGQVEALFKDFLAFGSVRAFDILRLESDGRSSSLVQGRLVLTDREGRPARVSVHLAFQPEEGRWVLREVKETAE